MAVARLPMTIRRASSREVRGVQSMKAPVCTVQFRQRGSHMRMVACVGGTKTTAPAAAPRMAQCCPRRLPELTPCYEEVTVPIIKASTAVADIVRWVHGNRLPSSGNAEHVDGSRHVGGGFSQFICVLTHRSVQDIEQNSLPLSGLVDVHIRCAAWQMTVDGSSAGISWQE